MSLAKVRESFNFSKLSSKFETVILDSSVWVSYLFPDDVNHKQAVTIFKSYTENEVAILVPEIVFYEVIAVFTKKGSYTLPKSFIKVKSDLITIEPKEFLDFISRYKNNFRTKTQDSLIIMHCLKYNVTYFETFDVKQKAVYNLIKNI